MSFSMCVGKTLGNKKILPSVSPEQDLGGVPWWYHLRHSIERL